jgi:hypothetical protein
MTHSLHNSYLLKVFMAVLHALAEQPQFTEWVGRTIVLLEEGLITLPVVEEAVNTIVNSFT